MVDLIINLKVGDVVNKKVLIPTIALGLAISAGAGWAATRAANSNMAQKLSEKLGIEQSTVSTALDSIRSERQAERQQEISESLDKAVSDGVITAEQKQAWLDKQSELEKRREQERAEMQQWLTDNGIDESKLQSYLGKGMGGMGGGMGRGGMMD